MSFVKYSHVQLCNGLTISFANFGDPDGKPAFYFHGLPGSRYEGEFLHQACQKYTINLIAPDRFGYGQTSPVSKDRYLRWTQCVQELADRLGFEKFYLLSYSGGGPYALACASILKDRVLATGICGSLGPLVLPEVLAPMQMFTRMAILIARHAPWFLAMSYGPVATIAARYFSTAAITFLGLINGEPDRTTMAKAEIRDMLRRNMKCAFSQGARGGIDDLIAANLVWPFQLTDINPLFLWAGDKDRVVPASHSEWIKQHVPHAKLSLITGEGHFSLPFNYTEDIVKTVTDTGTN